jgi:hypothetical protein
MHCIYIIDVFEDVDLFHTWIKDIKFKERSRLQASKLVHIVSTFKAL